MPDRFFELAHTLKQAGRPFATATVVRAEKPTSGKPGDRAIVTLDGRLHGWIGGSCAEPTVVRAGLDAMRDSRSRLIRLSPEPGTKAVPDGIEEVPMTCFSGGTLDIFIEPHQPRVRLIVAGSSPVAEALVRLGREMDYHVIALDPEATRDVPAAHETLRDVSEMASRVSPLTFVVVATHGHFDEPALAAALRAKATYVGLVSSRKRGEAVGEALRGEGLSEEEIARIRLPAGLDIGARRGDEIALSILAELIGVRRGMEPIAWEGEPEAAQRARASSNRVETGTPPGQATRQTEPGATPERPPGEAQAAIASDTIVQLGTARLPSATATQFARDPVCGMDVRIEGAQNTHEHEGTTYYFCCGGCRARFAKNPQKFLAGG